jgi:predicted unusual protein kinase regulating ubiquinone biosynthesis (AarF/ABC1/UbiB family)
MLLIRVGTVAEGVCRQLDPEFDFVAFVRSFLLEHGLFQREVRNVAGEITSDVRTSVPALARLPTRADRLLDRIERNELRVKTDRQDDSTGRAVGYAVIAGALFVASSVLAFHSQPYEFLGVAAGAVFLFLFYRAA